MAFLGIFGNYDKPGPGVNKDEPPKAAPLRFFEILLRKFSKLVQLNLIFLIPAVAALLLMVAIYLFPTHFVMQISVPAGALQVDLWALYAAPLPLILITPFTAGLTLITRNFSREEHAFVWSDFWSAVKGNWKYFLINGIVCYVVYALLTFSMIYYYNRTSEEWLFYIPFWICMVLAILFFFAQYYLPIIFITFDLKFWQAYRNALIFSLAGFWRNILLTLILGGMAFLVICVIPLNGLSLMIYLFLLLFFIFSFISYLVNFTIYPIIDRYMITPYQQKLEQEKNPPKENEEFSALFSQPLEEEGEEEKEKYVYVNGRLVKKSEWENRAEK